MKVFLQGQTNLTPDRLVIASEEWAFRERLRRSSTNTLDFPFLAFRVKPGGIHKPDSTWVQNWRVTHGAWVREFGDRVTAIPYYADYSCVFWSSDYANAYTVFEENFKDNWEDNTFEYEYIINGVPYLFDASFEFLNLELDPEYVESDEIIKNRLHSVQMDFQIKAFVFYGQGVQLADSFEVEMFYNGQTDWTNPDRTFDVETGTGTG